MQTRGTIHSQRKKKVLLMLEAGLSLSLSRSMGKQKRVLSAAAKAWREIEIDREMLYRHLKEFHNERLVEYRENASGLIEIILTDQGKRRVLSFKVEGLQLKPPKRWDGRWRFVAYDIPHHKRNARDALGRKLKELGFYQWQKSVLVYPYPCRDEIDFIVEFFELRPYVRYAEMLNPTNEAELKLKFDL
ncbi:MAG: hypothetical protein HYT48_02980 [Candidatus Vogelbacteria bacterium]|nr:hypothetical protein [Candidatus Vogelbacteria bacterium]